MKTVVGIVTALLLVASLTSATAAGLPGKYKVAGKNADGSPYSGTAEIVATSETTCRIAWQTGSTTSEGICMRAGAECFGAGSAGAPVACIASSSASMNARLLR